MKNNKIFAVKLNSGKIQYFKSKAKADAARRHERSKKG